MITNFANFTQVKYVIMNIGDFMKNNINLNLYKTFYDVARYGSFSKAAEFTFSTQPSISKQIKNLENQLETELFHRKPNGVELTEKGKELLFYIEKAYGNILTAERIMLETDNLSRGKLSIGMPSNMYKFIIESIKDFNKKYPNIEITIMTGTTTYLMNQLDMHKIDLIIDTLPINDMNNDMVVETIKEMNYCFISNKNENVKSLKDLENYSLILPISGTNNREVLDELLFKNDITLNNVINIHTSELIIDSVKANMGIGYILEDLVKDDSNINVLNIKEKLPIAKLTLIYNKKFLTSAPRKFIESYIKTDMK